MAAVRWLWLLAAALVAQRVAALVPGHVRGGRLGGLRMSAPRIESKGSVHKVSFEVAGKPMSFESGKMGRQASGSVVARTMDTMVYSTVCSERDAQPVDFTPLRVDFFARYSAVGQTIGAFHRRDSRGDDNEILVARLIDRPIRPMIAEGWQHDTQILAWVLSYDKQHSPDALAINAASAAMCLSEVPMLKPVAGVEVALLDGELIVNPTKAQAANATLALTLAGTKDGILMIEGAADFLSEETMMAALTKGHEAIGVICDALSAFQKVAGKPKKTDTLRKLPVGLIDSIDAEFGADMRSSLSVGDKHERGRAVGLVEAAILKRFCSPAGSAARAGAAAPAAGGGSAAVAAGAPAATATTASAAAAASASAAAATGAANADADAAPVPGPADEDLGLDSVVAEAAPGDTAEEDEASELKGLGMGLGMGMGQSGSGSGFESLDVKIATKKLLVRNLRRLILQTGRRSDGRGVEDVRPIEIETDLLPNAHGSSLFTRCVCLSVCLPVLSLFFLFIAHPLPPPLPSPPPRGETQSLSTATLGSKAMEMRVETLDSMSTKRFYLQYRFPPSSVGEVGRVGGIGRREVGHGNLAERALVACLPSAEAFPYSIRAESLITESCGSSSMATVCGCCLAMLDAGVPLSTSVAGVAMGLILGENEGDEPVILTDILGLEDALGTMDFKVAGNETGITTFQLDIKSEGLTIETLSRSLAQAKRGRLSILQNMRAALSEPRPLKASIPKILSFFVPSEALGRVIGPKGATVTKLIETHGLVNINLEDSGLVQVRLHALLSLPLSSSFSLSLSHSLHRPHLTPPFTPHPTLTLTLTPPFTPRSSRSPRRRTRRCRR